MIDAIIEKFKRLQESSDFVVVEGTDFAGFSSNVEFNGNVSIAKNLGIPAAIILNCSHKSDVEIVEQAISTTNAFLSNGVQVLTLVANKVEQGKETELLKKNSHSIAKGNFNICDSCASGVEQSHHGGNPRCDGCKGFFWRKPAYQSGRSRDRRSDAAAKFPSKSEKQHPGHHPRGSGDIIIGALQANISKNFGKIAGLVLSGGMLPEDSIVQLVEGLETVVPILQVEEATFEVVTKINDIKARISADDKEKKLLSELDCLSRLWMRKH